VADWRNGSCERVHKPKKRAPQWMHDHYYATLLRKGILDVPAEYFQRFGMACLADTAILAADYLVLLYGREYTQINAWLDGLRALGIPLEQRYQRLIDFYRQVRASELMKFRDPYQVWAGVYDEWEINQILKDNQFVRNEYERHVRPWRPRGQSGRPAYRMDGAA